MVDGRVFEVTNPHAGRADWNLVPLPDTELLVFWRAEIDASADSQSKCLASVRTKSRTDGTFSVADVSEASSLELLFVAEEYCPREL